MSEVIRRPGGYVTTPTERMKAARRVKADAISRELLWAIIASHIRGDWHSKLMAPERPQTAFPALLVLDTIAGRIVYRLTQDELESGLLGHLGAIQPNDGKPSEDKIGLLWQLAQTIT